jgi:hypothetical protein
MLESLTELLVGSAGVVTAVTIIVAGVVTLGKAIMRAIGMIRGRGQHVMFLRLLSALPRRLTSVGLALLLIGVTLSVFIVTTDPCQERTWVQIASPEHGDKVASDSSVTGSFNCLREDDYLWLFIRPERDGSYYPQSGMKVSRKDGVWNVVAHFGLFGPPNAPGATTRRFTLFAVVGDNNANQAFQDAASNNVGMDSFTTSGAAEYAEREITAEQPAGSIVSPKSGHAVPGSPKTYEAKGTLSNIPKGHHAWLVVQKDNALWPKEKISTSEQKWTRRLREDTPPGDAFSLMLLMTGPAGNKEIEDSRQNKKEAPLASITGSFQLAILQGVVVAAPPCREPPLRCLFSQPELGGGMQFAFRNRGGVETLTTDFTDAPDCRRVSRSMGLRVTYSMSGNMSGGWGIHWSNSPSRHFNAQGLTSVALSVKGARGREAFQVGLKDTSGREVKIESRDWLIVSGSEWKRMEVPLTAFRGVRSASVENLNIGFSRNHGRGQLCIDEIAFT